MTLKEYRLEPIEDEREKSLRLWKEKLSFLARDLISYVIAYSVIVGAMLYSFWTLAHPNLPREDRQWALSMLMALGTAVTGFVFGRAAK